MHDDRSPGSTAEGEQGPRETSRRAREGSLLKKPADGATRCVVLILHGGRARSTASTRPWQLAYRRMIPIARALHNTLAARGTAVWVLRNRVRGWNEPRQDPVIDARTALVEIRREHPGSRIVVIGHSMGGRAALRIADDAGVTAVCALAPWLEAGEPVEQLNGRAILVAHGDRDRRTSPNLSSGYVARAHQAGHDIGLIPVRRSGHAMLRQFKTWNRIVGDFVADAVSAGTPRTGEGGR